MKRWWILMRVAIASVWLYQGAWKKILAVDPQHLDIVSSVPSFLSPRAALGAIGLLESMFAVLVLSGTLRRVTAISQISVLVGMNVMGTLFAGDKIADIPAMVTMNAVFALAIWGVGFYER